MRLKIEWFHEPNLTFPDGVEGWEPKVVLSTRKLDRNSSRGETVRLGLVAFDEDIELVHRWFDRMRGLIVSSETNARRNRPFPGLRRTFDCSFDIPDRFTRRIDRQAYGRAASLSARDRFEPMLDLYGGRVESLFGDVQPDCVLVCLPDELADLRISNPKLTWREREVLERLQREDEAEQLSLFVPSPEELRLAAELRPQAEELLFRNFYRALKARCMNHKNAIPIQVLRKKTYVGGEGQQSDATRAWNLAVSLYYKSGHIPWRPARLGRDTCFVGVSFHHLKRRSGDIVYASLAQAFSGELEPFTLQGGTIPKSQTRHRQPYLTDDQSAELVERVVANYAIRAGSKPSRVVVHKTSRYQPEEEAGFREGLRSTVAGGELVWFAPTGFRLLRRGVQEPWRGSLCSFGDDQHFLFTTGFIPAWNEYPGPHIPAPLQIGACGETDIRERAQEILSLTKMNWNNAEAIGRHPITISFARKVGTIMTEMSDDAEPNPLYRFYM
jgi:hypothetical protein